MADREALKKITTVTYPREWEKLTYEEIVGIIKKKYTAKKKKPTCRWENQIHGNETGPRRV